MLDLPLHIYRCLLKMYTYALYHINDNFIRKKDVQLKCDTLSVFSYSLLLYIFPDSHPSLPL